MQRAETLIQKENKKIVTQDVPLKSVQQGEFVEACMKHSVDPHLRALGATILPCRSPQSPCLKVTATSAQIKKALDVVNMHISTLETRKYMYSKAGEANILKNNKSTLKIQAKSFGCNLEISEQVINDDNIAKQTTTHLIQSDPKTAGRWFNQPRWFILTN